MGGLIHLGRNKWDMREVAEKAEREDEGEILMGCKYSKKMKEIHKRTIK